MNPKVKRGYEFTHQTALDPSWQPGPGQRYADAPKARMVVTRATRTTVWFGFTAHRGVQRLDRQVFEARYVHGDPLSADVEEAVAGAVRADLAERFADPRRTRERALQQMLGDQ